MKKSVTVLLSILLLATPALALNATLENVWMRILWIGNLGFLGISDGSLVVAFTRLMIGVLMFTVFFGVLTALGAGPANAAPGGARNRAVFYFLTRSQAGVVAAVLAIISAVFMPASVLLATGAGWATAVSLLLIGGPIVGVFWLLWTIPPNGQPDTAGSIILKLIICLLLFWILTAMKYHVMRLA